MSDRHVTASWLCATVLAAIIAVPAAGEDKATVIHPNRGALSASPAAKASAVPAQRRALLPAATDDGALVFFDADDVAVPEPQGGVAGIGVVCGGAIPAHCQLPDQGGHGASNIVGATSDANASFGVADNFVTSSNANINSVCWWGFYLDFNGPADCSPGAVPDQFTITYYNNEPGCPDGAPGSVIAGPFAVFAVKAPTGNLIPTGSGNLPEFEYTASHPLVNVPAGACRWIEIQNNTAPSSCFWLWSTAPPGDGDSHQFGGTTLPDRDFDLAFCVNTNLASAGSACALPVLPACVGATGECGAAHAGPGCNDPCCCTAVCGQLPLCCVTNWDAPCASAGLSLGCAVFPLCQATANCQVYGDLDAFNSTTGDFAAADDFQVTTSGTINSICWQGSYSPATGTDSFTVRYYADNNKFPAAIPLAVFSQANNTLTAVTRNDTARDISGTAIAIFQYTATHAAFPVVAGNCYWISITNTQATGNSWYWALAEEGANQSQPAETLPREGNGRCLVDGSPPDGYSPADIVADYDFAFCVGKVLASPACGFTTVVDTGPHQTVLFDANNTGNYQATHVGFSSGNLNNGSLAQRRAAQAFTLPPLPNGQVWKIDQLAVEGFDPGGVTNQFINFEVFARSGLNAAPTPATLRHQLLNLPVDTNCTDGSCDVNPTTERLFVVLGPDDLVLPPGNYWLTMWASNNIVPFTPSNFAWFINAPNGINNACAPGIGSGCSGNAGCVGPPPGTTAMWRACTYPVPGFQGFTAPVTNITVDPVNDPTPDPADLLNCAMILRGQHIVGTANTLFWFPAQGAPIIHEIADLDSNGSQDTVVVIPNPSPLVQGKIQVFRNLGGNWAGFLANSPITVGHDPSAVAVGRFNSDLHRDIAVTNAADDTVTILLNTGLGNAMFTTFATINVGNAPSAIIAADFNEDSFTDLAVTNELDNNLQILLGNGTGNFVPSSSLAPINVGNRPVAMVIGDFDGNKCPDIAGGNIGAAASDATGNAFVLLGLPGSGFVGPFFYPVGANPTDLATDDLDGNGYNDIVVSNSGSNSLSVLLNTGGGSFVPGPSESVGTQPLSVEAFQLDADADTDLAVVAGVGSARVVQLLRNLLSDGGSFDFAPPFTISIGKDANFVMKGLINTDLVEDLVVVNTDDDPPGGSVSVLLFTTGLGTSCPWDCGAPVDGQVNVVDFLAVLQQWGQTGTSCDFDNNGVATVDFLALLQHWGPCP